MAPSRAALCVWLLIRCLLVPIQCLSFHSAGAGSCAWLDGAAEARDLPGAGSTASSGVRGGPAAKPVAVQVGGWMVRGEALLVTLAHFGEDVDPVLGLHTVVGLDIQRALWLDDLEHLSTEKGIRAIRPAGARSFA